MKIHLYIFLLLLIAADTHAQSSNQWKYIRPSNTGLAGATCIPIAVDACNNIWTGGYLPFWSEGSLVRFDDSVFTNWSNFEGFLPADRVYDIAFDSRQEVWVATNGVGNGIDHGGLVHYDGNNWTTYNMLNTPLPADDLRDVAVDHNDNIWVTFWNTADGIGGVAKFDRSNWTFFQPANSPLPTISVTDIAVDHLNNIWVGSDQGLCKYDGINWTVFTNANSGLSNYDIHDVEFDKTTNKLYVATGIAIDIFDGTTWTHLNSANAPISATGLYEVDARGDSIVIGTIGGTYNCYVYDGNIWNTHPELDQCYDVRIDNTGNFWISGLGYLEKFDGTDWTSYNGKNTNLTSMFNDDVFVDSRNRAWFSSNDNGGINMWDCRIWQDYNPYNAGLWPQPITYTGSSRGVCEDDLGDIWMTFSGVAGGVVQVPAGDVNNPAAWTVWENVNSGVSLQFVHRIAADHSGNVWVGYEDACSVSRYSHATNSWTDYNLYQLGQITCGAGTGITSIRTDDSSNVWICGVAGLSKFDQVSWTFYSHLNTPMLQGMIMDIAIDSAFNKWIATENGLYRFDGNNWTLYDSSNSPMEGNFCSAVIADKAGRIWVASRDNTFPYSGSLCSFDGMNWNAYTITNSGLQEKFINRLSLDTLGNIWVLSETHGAAIFNPDGVIGFDCIDRSLQFCGLTAIPDVQPSNEVNVSPNPFTSSVNIRMPQHMKSTLSISVMDVTGKILFTQLSEKSAGEYQYLDLSGLKSGIYFLKLEDEDYFSNEKVIKQN
jgi:ligand-binding sensor domain-containing protein